MEELFIHNSVIGLAITVRVDLSMFLFMTQNSYSTLYLHHSHFDCFLGLAVGDAADIADLHIGEEGRGDSFVAVVVLAVVVILC